MRDRIANDTGLPGDGVEATRLIGARDPAVVTAYTHEVEMALLAACLRSASAFDEASVAGLLGEHFLDPACGRLWEVLLSARIEGSEVSDHMLYGLVRDDDADVAGRFVDRLRHPLVRPRSVTKFARDVKRLARERAA